MQTKYVWPCLRLLQQHARVPLCLLRHHAHVELGTLPPADLKQSICQPWSTADGLKRPRTSPLTACAQNYASHGNISCG